MTSLSKEQVYLIFDKIRKYVGAGTITVKELEKRILREINDEEKRDSKDRFKQFAFFI
jgi:hypothetical protein